MNDQNYPLWNPDDLRPCRSKRYSWIDIASESVFLRDKFGVVQFRISDLPGALLTFLMLHGLRRYLSQNTDDARTLWKEWQHGLMPNVIKRKRARPKRPRPLAHVRRAIVNAMLQLDGCKATLEQTEALVRNMTARQVQFWAKEPDVVMHLRLLRGDKPLKLANLLPEIPTT